MSVRLTSRVVAPLLVGVFLGGIGISAITGHWQTESTKVPVTIRSGEFEGAYDPGDIRGSYSFEDVTNAFDVPVDDLARAFGFTDVEDPGSVQAKDLEEMYGTMEQGEIGTDSVRYFVALYVGIPYEPEEDTLMPGPAVSILRDKVTEEQLADLRSRSVSLADAGAAAGVEVEEHQEDPDDRSVKGRTTFQELLDWGLSKEQIEETIGVEMGKPGVTVRDHLAGRDIEFMTAREKLQELVDAAAAR